MRAALTGQAHVQETRNSRDIALIESSVLGDLGVLHDVGYAGKRCDSLKVDRWVVGDSRGLNNSGCEMFGELLHGWRSANAYHSSGEVSVKRRTPPFAFSRQAAP